MISVCIATYNGAKYIKEQVDSILMQLEADDELIVSDDRSTDDTINILKSYNDSRIKIFNHNRKFSNYNNHQKVSANFENAIMHASGDWIFLSDQDDVWAPNKVEVCSKYFSTHDLIVSDCCFIKDGKVDLNSSILKGRDPIWSFMGKAPNYHGCCMAFKSSRKNILLPFPTKLYTHDAWIGHIIRIVGKTIILNKPNDCLVYYRLLSTSVSHKNKRNILYTINHRSTLLFQIAGRLVSNILKSK